MNASYLGIKTDILKEIDHALSNIDEIAVERLMNEILAANQVFFVGVGRVLLALQCVAKRLAHLGISTFYVGEITEPAIKTGDLLIVGSGSGATLFPVAIAKKAKSLGAKVAHIGSAPNSPISEFSDFMVRVPVRTKLYLDDEIDSIQPMTSLFEQCVLLLGDILATKIINECELDLKELWHHHANLE